MKNKRFFVGIPGLLLVFGLIVMGCDNGTTPGGDEGGKEQITKFEGTWKHQMDELDAVYTFTGNKWQFSSVGQNGVATGPFSGTFTHTDTTLTLTVSSGGSDNWTYSYTLNGDTLNLLFETGNLATQIQGPFQKK
jgi:hypothetical protein